MDVWAFCDERYAVATRKVVGKAATIITSGPVFAYDFEHEWLAGHDFVYVDLHGQPGSVYLYSGAEQDRAALAVDDVRRADLGGAVVFATTCFLPETPFLSAFLEAGARAVIGGHEENFGARTRLSGAQRLAKWVLAGLRKGKRVDEAVRVAKAVLRADVVSWAVDGKATADALRFEVWTPRGEERG